MNQLIILHFFYILQGGKDNVVEMLIKAGAKINMTDHTGRTALYTAVEVSVTYYTLLLNLWLN